MKRRMAIAGAAAAVAIGLLAAREVKRRQYSFRGKVVVITGGSRGLGLAIARRLADERAKIVLLARTSADLRNAEDMLIARGAEVVSIPCDVRQQPEVEAAIALAIERFGRIDVLINNAGIIQIGPLDNMGLADFENAMATHFYGPLFAMLEVIPHMRRQGSGRIVNVASIGGKIAAPHLMPYCASKFALVGLSDAMRAELARDNIKVTTAYPWFMRTGSLFNIEVKGMHEKEFAWFATGASLPIFTVHADRAARKIIEACRRGSPRLVMSVWGKAAVLINEITPGVMTAIQQSIDRMLPKPDLKEGDFPRTGWQSRSRLEFDPLMRLSQAAALRNNELRHAIHASRRSAAKRIGVF